MSQPEKKLEKFSSVVLQDAQEQREKILQEIEDYRKTQLEKAEEDILHDAYIMIQNEISSIKNQQSRKLSLAELKSRRELLTQREAITEQVFEQTANRITEFSNTTEYVTMLCDGVRRASARLADGGLVIQVKAADLPLADKLIEACGRSACVEANPVIRLGGFRLVSAAQGVVIDETLDLKLSRQKDWFAASSGLSLGL